MSSRWLGTSGKLRNYNINIIYINIKSSFKTEHPLLENTGFATDYNILTLVECVYHGNSSMLNFNLWGF